MAFGVFLCAREMWSEKPLNKKTLVLNIVVLAGLVAICATSPLLAQSPSFSDFSALPNPNLMVLNGNAAKSGTNVLRLTSATQGQVGSAWFTNLQPVAEGFSTTFTFQISNGGELPADGLAFVIQNSEAGTSALGGAGGAIGYGGILNSLAIEFDTFRNPWDQDANHVAIQSCGTGANTYDHTNVSCTIAVAPAPVSLSNGSPHTVKIEYTPATSCGVECLTSATLQVTIDTFEVFDGPVPVVDLTSLLNLAPLPGSLEGAPFDSAYVGFTGATGSLDEDNDILSWTFTPHASQIITQPAPANVFTTFNFGSYLYKVRPDQNIDALTVTEVPTVPSSFNPGSNFPGAKCIVYDSTGGDCVEFHAACSSASNNACTNVNYDVVTSYDVPSTNPAITNPAFLKATGQNCTPAAMFDSNIITAFTQTRTDPTTKGKSKPTFSCFVAVQGVTYSRADVDIANFASPKVKTGSNLTYIIPVLNFGPASAQGVAITDTIPSGTNFVSTGLCTLGRGCSATECSVSGGAVTCTVGTLDPFTLQVMVLVVNVTASSGTITDTATTTFFNPDPRPADNVATAVTVISNKRGDH